LPHPAGSILAGLPFRDDDAEEESDVQGHQENGDDSHEGRSDEETVRGAHRLRNSLTSEQCAQTPQRICNCHRSTPASWRLKWAGGLQVPGRAGRRVLGGAIETKEPKNQWNIDVSATLKIQTG